MALPYIAATCFHYSKRIAKKSLKNNADTQNCHKLRANPTNNNNIAI